MKKLITLSLFVFGSLMLSAQTEQAATQATEIKWLTWDQMVEAQKLEPRNVFIDVYTDWCGWCKRMDASTFKDPMIVDYISRNFYAVKLDAEMDENIIWNGMTFVNPNPGVSRSTHQFAASILDNQLSYPTFVMLDKNFNRTNIIKGFQQPEPLIGNLIFFNTDQHVRYNQYMDQQRRIQEARMQQQQTQGN